MDSSASTALQGCVGSLRTSMQLLESSINILDTGVNDYPRLTKVLQTTRVRLQIIFQVVQHNSHNSIALRTSLRTLPPNRPTNPPLISRTRTQRPSLARRNAPRQNVSPGTRSPRQSRTARRASIKPYTVRQTQLSIEKEFYWCWRGCFFGWRTEQFGTAED